MLTIENCEFEFKCPMKWSALEKDFLREDIRHCDSCEKAVYRCETDDELNRHAEMGHCVAVESRPSSGMLLLGTVPLEYDNGPKLRWD